MVDVNNPMVQTAVRMALKMLNINISADDLLKNYAQFQSFVVSKVQACEARIQAVEEKQNTQIALLEEIREQNRQLLEKENV